MYRYIAFLWSPTSQDASQSVAALAAALERATSWIPVFASLGIRVFLERVPASDLRVYLLPANRGVILGRLFPAELSECAPTWEPNITDRDAIQYLATAGRQLTADYWGAYIAFIASPNEPHRVVLRDPSGKLPCYRLRYAQVDIVFSDAAALSPLSVPALAFNLSYLAAFIYMDSLQIRESALAEVTEVLAGECFEALESTSQQRLAWDPRAVAGEDCRLTFEQAAVRLQHVTRACVNAWASVHRQVLHCLSGGLDSSIVLGCLSRAPSSSCVCINYYVDGVQGDERAYARLAAESANVRLVEIRLAPEQFAFDSMLALPRAVKPSFSQCARLMQLGPINALARAHGADAVWKGHGGDHIFLKLSNVPSASDYLADQGVRWGWAAATRDAARHSGQSYSAILRSALSSRRKRRWQPASAANHELYFVRRDALPESIELFIAHPWSIASADLPPGRQCQIYQLAEAVNRHKPIAGRECAYEHHPLLSQPIVEQCLRIPTYVHLRGGRHRALAREAFREWVPRQILEREIKGQTTTFALETIRRHESFLCELLLDGVLVRERLVDRAQLETCLRGGHALIPEQLPPLLACIAAEIWARAWRG